MSWQDFPFVHPEKPSCPLDRMIALYYRMDAAVYAMSERKPYRAKAVLKAWYEWLQRQPLSRWEPCYR